MSEMIERVALALLHATCRHYGDPIPENPDLTLTSVLARAAIEAMREPTDEMRREGKAQAVMSAGAVTVGVVNEYGYAGSIWRAMIDAALTAASRAAPPASPSPTDDAAASP